MAAPDPSNDLVDFTLNLCPETCSFATNMKTNKQCCQQIAQTVKELEQLILTIKYRGTGQASPALEHSEGSLLQPHLCQDADGENQPN
ncbi:hypothetical protein PBY51_011363 [Eleginops maclovinus]|uniref:Uncharacterized protein n=1 Tax=Eleginops maclovinus TaxID=56733 RepID=A0AAN8ASB7_ELEMC|nr:hypothetical protein PBY51_011363 [Eleginops maclovinus]